MKSMLSALGLATVLAASPAWAQSYPAKPITMIVPFAAGGPTDVIARIVADNMSKTLGQQIVVENVAGAGGTTGTTRAAQSALLLANQSIQLHGAIGTTDEYDLGVCVNRALTLSAWMGNAAEHRRRFGTLSATAPRSDA